MVPGLMYVASVENVTGKLNQDRVMGIRLGLLCLFDCKCKQDSGVLVREYCEDCGTQKVEGNLSTFPARYSKRTGKLIPKKTRFCPKRTSHVGYGDGSWD